MYTNTHIHINNVSPVTSETGVPWTATRRQVSSLVSHKAAIWQETTLQRMKSHERAADL